MPISTPTVTSLASDFAPASTVSLSACRVLLAPVSATSFALTSRSKVATETPAPTLTAADSPAATLTFTSTASRSVFSSAVTVTSPCAVVSLLISVFSTRASVLPVSFSEEPVPASPTLAPSPVAATPKVTTTSLESWSL